MQSFKIFSLAWTIFMSGANALSYIKQTPQIKMGNLPQRFVDSLYRSEIETKLNVVEHSELSQARKAKIPIYLSFRADSKSKITFPNMTSAATYLSLPASEYRLLDLSFVERMTDCNDTFTLIFPLQNLLVAMDTIADTAKSNSFLFLKYYDLRSSVSVNVDARMGRIEMRSGEFFFQKSADTTQNPNISIAFSDIPQWLLWNAHSSHSSREGKSFLQPFFRADIVWNPNLKEAKSTHLQPKTLYSHLQSIFNRKEIHHHESLHNKHDEIVPLIAEVKVSCGASVHIQPGNNVFRALQSTPVKLAIEKIISLTLKTILLERQSQFNSALIRDCKDRFG